MGRRGIPSIMTSGPVAVAYPWSFLWIDPGGDAVEAIGSFVKADNNGSGLSFDTTQKKQGVGSYKFDSGASNLITDVYNPVECLTEAGSRISRWFRYDTVPANKAAITVVVNSIGSQGQIFQIAVVPSGAGVVLRYVPPVGSTTDGTTVLLANTWYRISWSFTLASADNCACKVYLDGGQEISVTAQSTNGRNTARAYFSGWNDTPGANRICWFDQDVIDNGNDLADIGDLRSTYKAGNQAGGDAEWDNSAGTGSTNDRPLNETNYVFQSSSSQLRQNGKLQSASQGDIDISSNALLGYLGWVWAKEAAVSGTPKLTLNGIDYAITLTTSPAFYSQIITDNNYPSNNRGIGMVSSGTADDTFMYEKGTVLVYRP